MLISKLYKWNIIFFFNLYILISTFKISYIYDTACEFWWIGFGYFHNDKRSTTNPTYVYKTCSQNNTAEKKVKQTFLSKIFFFVQHTIQWSWSERYFAFIFVIRDFECICAQDSLTHCPRSHTVYNYNILYIKHEIVFAVKWIEYYSLYSVDKRPATPYKHTTDHRCNLE